MSSTNITFLVFAYNEKRRIEPMLKCLQGHGTIIVIDNFSSDNTIEIARKYTNEIYQHKNIGYVENAPTMDFVLGKIKTRWAYLAFVDELIPRSLMELLKKVATGDRYDIVEIYRQNFMYGQKVFNYGKHHIRMFVKDSVDFRGNIVHKRGQYKVGSDRVLRIPAHANTSIWHFSSFNTDRLELTHNRYANLEAQQRHELLGQKFSGTRALFKLLFYFFGTYIGLGGFRGGWPGLFISLQIAYFKFSIESRLWELDNGVSLESIEKRYDLLKERILSEYIVQ